MASLLGLVATHLPSSVLLLRDPNWMVKIEGLVGPILGGSVQHSPMLFIKVTGGAQRNTLSGTFFGLD
jgi:hypothetical protein